MALTVGVNCFLFLNDLRIHGRIKRVKVRNEALSDEEEVRRGVQQGRVLRLIFFRFLCLFVFVCFFLFISFIYFFFIFFL